MRRLTYLWPYAAFLAIALGGWFFARPDAAAERGPDVSATAGLDPGEDLDRRIAATLRRSQLLRRIARAVVEGRITLLEAAERFRELNESSCDFSQQMFRKIYAGASDDERYARYVIAVAESECAGDRQRARAVVTRLEAELSESLRRGTFRLAL
jgi:hypothetical protein